jgi:hypothetical protein
VIHKFINSIWNKEDLPEERKQSIILPIDNWVIKLRVIIIVGYHCYQLQHFIKHIALRLSPDIDEILPLVPYGCETWSLTVSKEQLRVFENMVLRRISGPESD